MSEYSHLTEQQLEQQIESSRPNMHVPTSRYHDFIAEKERREKEKTLIRDREKQKVGKEQFESVAGRLDKIIKLLELIGKHPWWTSIIALLFAIVSGAMANLLTDLFHYLFNLIIHK